MSAAASHRSPGSGWRLRPAGLALGFALGGFFDGILLHQILQWHHLLGGLDGGTFDDLRAQILAGRLPRLAGWPSRDAALSRPAFMRTTGARPGTVGEA